VVTPEQEAAVRLCHPAPSAPPCIEVRVAIRRTVVASFGLEELFRATGISKDILLTSFDTWPDDTAEIFADYITDDGNYCAISVWDNSDVESYKIKQEEQQ
jgi:hypothetical protein